MASDTLMALYAVAGGIVVVAAVLGVLVYRYSKGSDDVVRHLDAREAGAVRRGDDITPTKKKRAKKGALATPLHTPSPMSNDLSREGSRRSLSQSLETLERVIRARSVTPITSFYGNRVGVDVSSDPKYADMGTDQSASTDTAQENERSGRRFLGAAFDSIDARVRGSVEHAGTVPTNTAPTNTAPVNTAPTDTAPANPLVVDPYNISLEGLITVGSGSGGGGKAGAILNGMHADDGFGDWLDEDPELAGITMGGFGFALGEATPPNAAAGLRKSRPSGLLSGRHQDFDRAMSLS